jgi:hypothetical protein
VGTSNSTTNLARRGRIQATVILVSAGLAGMASVAVHNRFTVVATGAFHPVEIPGSGWVRVVHRGQERQLQLIGVRLENGPDAEVRLIAASDALDSSTVEATASRTLGVLPAGAASAAYRVDPSVDFERVRAVSLWSVSERRNLITAPLQVAESRFYGAN